MLNPYGGNVRVVNAAPESGWVLNSFRALNPANAEFLTAEQASGGLYAFTATWCKTEFGELLASDVRPEACPDSLVDLESTEPTAPMQLEVYMDIPAAELLDIAKDLVDTPSLLDLATIEDTGDGAEGVAVDRRRQPI